MTNLKLSSAHQEQSLIDVILRSEEMLHTPTDSRSGEKEEKLDHIHVCAGPA